MATVGVSPIGATRDARPLVWSCAAFTLGVLLHVDRVPPWVSAAALALVAWRLLSARSRWRGPGLIARAMLALLTVAAVLTRFHTLNGLAAGTALLILMAALKLLETRTGRDQLVMVGAGLFLLLAACLDRQSLARAPLYLLQAWLCCAALAVVTARGLAARPALALAGRALLLATPLAAILFVSFPRLAGAFWAVPRGEEALTGLSDTMTPGGITHLTASYYTAFRARFTSAPRRRRSVTGAARCYMTLTVIPGAAAQVLRPRARRSSLRARSIVTPFPSSRRGTAGGSRWTPPRAPRFEGATDVRLSAARGGTGHAAGEL